MTQPAARPSRPASSAPPALPIVAEDFEPAEHPNLQTALDTWLQEPGRSSEAVGIAHDKRFGLLGLGDLAGPGGGAMFGGELLPGPVLADLRAAMRARNVYRSRVISLAAEPYGPPTVRFHALPAVARKDIVLADGVLEWVERHTIEFSAHRERLLAAGRHLRRGLLLHGQPGTGKTLIAMYLAGRQPDRTVLLVTGRTVGLLRRACELARLLAPSTVVLEDVDLIAEERTRQEPGCTTLLFELLNEMDGLAEDVEVVFVLTTNRPDLLEPALAARPGRVDLVVEVPLPDAACRRRLLELYGRGLTLRVSDLDRLVEGLEGASPAFIRELLRKAAARDVRPVRRTAAGSGPRCPPARPKLTKRPGHR